MSTPSRWICGAALLLSAGCATAPPAAEAPSTPPPLAWEALIGEVPEGAEVYVAELQPVNTTVVGRPTVGRAAFVTWGDSVRIIVSAVGLAPNRMHRPEVHGVEGKAYATCPLPLADTDESGIIDPTEAEPYSGRALFALPMATEPAHPDSMTLIRYDQAVSAPKVEAALRRAKDIRGLALERRTVYMQSLPAESKAAVPEGAASVAGPFPVACGKIVRREAP